MDDTGGGGGTQGGCQEAGKEIRAQVVHLSGEPSYVGIVYESLINMDFAQQDKEVITYWSSI